MPSSDDESRYSNEAERVAIGVITGAQGIRGQLKVKSFTDNPLDLTAYGPLLNKDGTKRFDLSIDAESKGGLVVSIKGIKDRNAAELMRGTELFVVKARLPEADDEEFYYADLVGLEVRSAEGVKLGEITAVHNFGASDVVEIRLLESGKKELFPFTKAVFPEVNIKEGFCIADLPEMVEAKSK